MKKLLILIALFGFTLFMVADVFAGILYIDNETKEYTSISIKQDGTVTITTAGLPPPAGNQITGRIYSNYNGDPSKSVGIPNVTVSLNPGSPTTTNTNGNYTFSGLADGTFTVTPTKSNYSFNPVLSNVTVPPNQTADFVATPTNSFSISGNVKDKSGVNLSNVEIQLRWGTTLLDNTDRTDGSGNYIIDGLADGVTYTITPVASGYTFSPTSLNVLINGSNVTGNNFVEQGVGGKWTEQVNIARLINSFDGYLYKLSNIVIAQGKTSYFLIDPLNFNTGYVSSIIGIGVRDPTQSQYIDIYYPKVYRLDRNNNELNSYIMSGSGDFSINIKYYTQQDYDNGVKYLIQITERGKGSEKVEIYWRWK
jgi:hypothetical protein